MELKSTQQSPVGGRKLCEVFGTGQPGWIWRVPAGQLFSLHDGCTNGPAGKFVRSPASRLWHQAHEASQITS